MGGKTKHPGTTLVMKPELRQEMREVAEAMGISWSEAVAIACEFYLAHRHKL